MKAMDRRLAELEAESRRRPKTRAEHEASDDELCAREGLTRAEVIAKWGSVPRWAYCSIKCLDPSGNPLPRPPREPEPDDGLDPLERYLAIAHDRSYLTRRTK